MPCTRSTACEILQIEGRHSVPGDGRRSVRKEPAVASTNPYVSSVTYVPLPNRNLKPQFQMVVFIGWCIVVLGVAAIILLPEPLISHYIDSIGEYGFFFLTSLPALYWEAFCRVSSRPISKTQSILSSSLRCWFIYGWGCLLTIFILSGVTRTGPFQDDRSLSETRHVGVMILSASIVIGAALLAGYDFWRHKQQATEQGDARRAADGASTNGTSPPAAG